MALFQFLILLRWKNKVKKLEKNLERLKVESEQIVDQNEMLKANHNNLNLQFDTKNHESQTLRVINEFFLLDYMDF